MADTFDSGIDKQRLLDEIVGASNDPLPPPPRSFSLLDPDDAVPISEIKAEPALPAQPPRPWHERLSDHRRELAAIVIAFCGAVWLSVGITARGGVPALVGFILLFAAGGMMLLDLWRAD